MKDKFLIGEMAKIFNISTDTLRYYDKIDVLKPEYDKKNDYRYYSIRSLFKLSRIIFLKNLDISLDDIKKYLKNKNTDNLLNLLKKKEKEIDVKINKLMNIQNKIHTKLELFENINNDLDRVKIKRIPERIGIFLDLNSIDNDYEIKQAFKEKEKHFRISSWLIEGQIYTSLSKENMRNKIFDKFTYFIEIVSLDSKFQEEFIVIPENDYACIVCIGPYDNIKIQYQLLTKWIEDNGYKIIGDSIEKNIVDYDFSDSENEYISEIQIPIAKNID
ncbi:MAG: MerR family transcriptional regulator [Clostridiales bacterium]|nr:MerR family transcriptional regulator [Clostridiales bacterium]